MRITKLGLALLSLMVLLLSGCGDKKSVVDDAMSSKNSLRADETVDADGFIASSGRLNMCPKTDYSPEKMSIDRDEAVSFVDNNRDLKDLGTDLVIQNLFNSKDTLYNFMKHVYQTMDLALADYRNEKKLDERAIFLLFKGGNVLRMVANEVFDQLSPEARMFMQREYAPYFKRSDADFSVYVDENRLQGLDYDLVFREVTELVFKQLNVIRAEFETRPERYFNFFRLNSSAAQNELNKSFIGLSRLPAVVDPENENWFNAKFLQLQLRDYQAEPGMKCFYRGQHDYRYEVGDGKIVTTRLSAEPHWIYNTDNRTLQWTWGSDPSKIVKFSLLRSKIALEYTFEKDGVVKRKPIGGELIDVSMPHRDDNRLRDFLDRYNETVREYTLISEESDEQFVMKAYSFANLVEDLQFIILDSFDRPWEGGPKYVKRINRLFFLFNVELLSAYGLSSVSREYLDGLHEKIIVPLNNLFPLTDDSKKVVEQLSYNINLISGAWQKMKLTNHFFASLSKFVERVVNNPKEGDQEGFQGLIDAMERNIDLSKELMKLRYMKINHDEVYNVETRNLF